MKTRLGILLLLAVVTLPGRALANVPNDQYGYLYYSPGLLLSPIGSIRFGKGSWEGGLLSGFVLGVDKVFRTPGSSTYFAFGPGFDWVSPVLYGAAGFEWKIFNWLTFRSELAAIASFQNPRGFALMGLALHI